MSDYRRHLDQAVLDHFKHYKEVLVLLGARQVGKTTLVKKCFPEAYYLSLDNETTKANLERYDISVYRQFLPADVSTVILDEIHLLSDPGRAAKIIYDQIPDIRLIVTGSSSFRIKNKASESLAGRKIDYHLYPLTFSEYLFQKGIITDNLGYPILENILKGKLEKKVYSFDLGGILNNVLIYGFYPVLIDRPNDKVYLKNLVDSVIFRDLLELKAIGNRPAALNLLRLLAYQIGSLVNVSELADRLHLDMATVRRYLILFEQSFIIFPLSPYAKKGRDEIGKMSKYYFYDLGLRNALIENFSFLETRDDFGLLFENFIISEVLKNKVYGGYDLRMNFWRNKQGSEIDLVIERDNRLLAVEIKTGQKRPNRAFISRYPKARLLTLTPSNFY